MPIQRLGFLIGISLAVTSACSASDSRDSSSTDGGSEATVSAKVIRSTCGGLDPLLNVNTVRVTRFDPSADGGVVITETPVASFEAELPALGNGRYSNVVVEALDTSGRLVSRGETGPLAGVKGARNICLRRIDAFTAANQAAAPEICSTLAEGRAGHVMTRLSDGRVLISGGFKQKGEARTYLGTTEVFDPRTGAVTAGPEILKRTFHTATQIPGTKWTLIAGGEVDGAAVGAAQIYDEETNSIVQNIPMKSKRTRHMAVIAEAVSGGTQPPVALVGGFANSDAMKGVDPLKTAEVLDLSTSPAQFRDVSTTLNLQHGLAEAAVVPLVEGSGRVAVIGGWDGQSASKNVLFLGYSPAQNGYIQLASTTTLNEAHLSPVAGAWANGLLLITGGFQSHDAATGVLKNPTATTEYLNAKVGGPFTKAPLATLPDAASFLAGVALPNGKLLTVGGLLNQTGASSGAASLIEVVESNLKRRPTSGASSQTRHLHAMTTLTDGTVLVSGGLQTSAGNTETLNQIDVFQPAYVIEGNNSQQ